MSINMLLVIPASMTSWSYWPELVGSRTGDLVVDRADGRLGLGIHGREGVDNRHPGAVSVVQRVADAGLRQAERSWSRDGFRAHAADSSTSAAEERSGPNRWEPGLSRASKLAWDPRESHEMDERGCF